MSGGGHYFVYIMASRKNGTLYTGVTNNLNKRVAEHKSALNTFSFVGKYKVHRLVYYETYMDVLAAIKREKRLKRWNRAWKLRLIEQVNPNWYDLIEHPEALQPFVEFNKV